MDNTKSERVTVKSKVRGMFMAANERSFGDRSDTNRKIQEWEVRPGGMLVQKRNFDSNLNSVSNPVIKVRIKYGSSCHEICISSQASFGELKKMLAEPTGLHPQEQKLIYKKKERDSKAFLDVAGVKNGSKLILIEDISSRERRCLEMIKSVNTEKASKSLQQISLEVDRLSEKVTALEAKTSESGKVAELDLDTLTETLMTKLVALDGIVVQGDLKLQKRTQEKRVQKNIETLDMLKLQNCKDNNDSNNGGKFSLLQKQDDDNSSTLEMATTPIQKQEAVQAKQIPVRHSEALIFTTKWETFD